MGFDNAVLIFLCIMLKNDQKYFKNDQTMFGHFPTLYIKGLKDDLKRKSKEKN